MTTDDRLVVAAHGILAMAPHVQAAMADAEFANDAMGMFIDRSVALGLASFRTTPAGQPRSEEYLYEGTERWTQHEVAGDWTPDAQVHELLALRVQLNRRARRPLQRLPIQPAFAVSADILARLGHVKLTAYHADLPLGVASDSLADLALSSSWFDFGAQQETSDFFVTIRTTTEDTPELVGVLNDQLNRYTPFRTRALTSVTTADPHLAMAAERVCFDGRPATSVAEEPIELEAPPAAAFRCRGVEWSSVLAAWTIELFGELIRRNWSTNQATIRLARADSSR